MQKINHVKNVAKEEHKNAVKFLGQSKLGCPALDWKKEKGDGELDPEIIPLLTEMNKIPFLHTTGSCAGHNLRDIKIKHKGWYVDIPYRITLTVHVKTEEIDSFIKIIKEFSSIADSKLWCELGYHDDLNNNVESGYVPFEVVIKAITKNRRDKYLEKLYKFTKSLTS
jgi:hypothetical protein